MRVLINSFIRKDRKICDVFLFSQDKNKKTKKHTHKDKNKKNKNKKINKKTQNKKKTHTITGQEAQEARYLMSWMLMQYIPSRPWYFEDTKFDRYKTPLI